MRHTAGQYLNVLGRAKSVTSNPPADVKRELARLWDDFAHRPFSPVGLSVDPAITADLDLLGGYGDMESFPNGVNAAPAGWTDDLGSGSIAKETTIVHGGAAALKLTNTKGAYRDFFARAGERLTLDAWLRGDATAAMRIRLQNRQTGKYLVGGAWQTAAGDLDSQTAASWDQTLVDFQVESLAALQAPTCTLRVTLLCNQAGSAYADDLSLFPNVNVCSIHGHNIDPLNAVELRSDAAAFAGAGTLEATLTNKQPVMWVVLATPVKKRYLRVKVVGTNTERIYIGELVVGYAEASSREHDLGMETELLEPQIRQVGRGGETRVLPLAKDHGPRAVSLNFQQVDPTQFSEMRDDIVRRSRNGAYPVLLIPHDDPTDVEATAILGRIDQSWKTRRALKRFFQNSLPIAEMPFPSVVPDAATDSEIGWLLGVDGAQELGSTTVLR